jgi:CheY-like chemotaxis protein
MLSLVARHIRSLGASVIEASDGDMAWEKAQKHHPDLIMLDVMMPGMSGWEVCKRVKGPVHGASFSRTGVIMLTGIGENLNDMTSPLFAADAWLNKPFEFQDLDAKIKEVLARYGHELSADFAHETTEAERDAEAAEEAEIDGPARPRPAKKAAAKKAPAKKAAAKKAPAKKAAAKKPAAKKAPAKKAAAKKPAAKKAPAKKAAAKKPAAKKAPAKKAAAKKPAAKKAPAKK